MLMALFQNKESLSSNKTTRVCGQADKNVQLQARPRGLIGVRRDFNLLLHPIVIRRLTMERHHRHIILIQEQKTTFPIYHRFHFWFFSL